MLKYYEITTMILFVKVYTRSVIDPIPAPSGNLSDGAKLADKQKKKNKMSDEEITERLRK